MLEKFLWDLLYYFDDPKNIPNLFLNIGVKLQVKVLKVIQIENDLPFFFQGAMITLK